MVSFDESVLNRITNIVQIYSPSSEGVLNPANWKKPLTGSFWGFSMVDMVYLVLELEKEFGIRFSPDELDDYGLSSIEKICTTLQKRIYP